jgi:hypothetical protein
MNWLGPGFCRHVDVSGPELRVCNAELKYGGRGPRPKWCDSCKVLVDAGRNRQNVARNRARYPEETRLTRYLYRTTDRVLRNLTADDYPRVARGKVLQTCREWENPISDADNHVQAILADTLFIHVVLKTPWLGDAILTDSLEDYDNIISCVMAEDLEQFGEGLFEQAWPPLLQGELAEETLGPFLPYYEHAVKQLGWDRQGSIWFNWLRVADCLYVEYRIEPFEREEVMQKPNPEG